MGHKSATTYFLNADQRGGTGPNGESSFTVDEAAVHLTQWGYSWSGDGVLGTAATVTYSFRATAPLYDLPYTSGLFTQFNAQQIAQAELSLQAWSDVANITFVRVGGTGYSNDAQMVFANYGGGNGYGGYAWYPGNFWEESGDVWINGTISYNTAPALLNFGRTTLMHEIGHAIGLNHGHENDVNYYEDSRQYTVMSYESEFQTSADYQGYYPASAMLDDIAAAQRLYGANMTTRTGDTTYGFNSNAQRDYFIASNAWTELIFAIWDAGGVDTLDFSGYADNQLIELRQGYFSNVGGLVGNVAIAIGAVVENAVGGSGADTINGNSAANELEGGGGNDTLQGLGGTDTFIFELGDGQDVITDLAAGETVEIRGYVTAQSVTQSGSNVIVTLSGSDRITFYNTTVATVQATLLFADAAPIGPTEGDDILTGTGGDDTIGALGGNDIVYGLGGNDTLNGGSGADAMLGGSGNDNFYVDNAGDQASEIAGEGTDIVYSSMSFSLWANVENLTLTGTATNGGGNAGNNIIIGNAQNNVLNGDVGADTMLGGAGNDIFYVDNAGDQVSEIADQGTDHVYSSMSFSLWSNVENLTLTGTATNGGGNAGNNVIIGNAQNNVLNGDIGADTMLGGAGNDIFYVDNAGDAASEIADQGTDHVYSSMSFSLWSNVENLTLTGSATNGGGNDLDNIIIGNAQNNVLNGDVGADTMLGGAGNDIFYVDNAGDQVSEIAGEGTDHVYSSMSFSLWSNVENLTLTGTAITGGGNAANNIIIGNAQNNVINGDVGADTMLGGAGNDIFYVDNAGDQVSEIAGEGTDQVYSSVSFTLWSNVENLTLTGASATNATGNAGGNSLAGNSAANVLAGGGGNDILLGGAGADSFLFDTSPNAAANADQIIDYSVTDDTVLLDDDIFAGLSLGTLDASAFRTGAAATDADDRIIYDSATGNIYYDADGNGGTAAVLFAQVSAGTALTNNDFMIVG